MENYHILELIGEGQFGKVYKGRHLYGSQIVALKFIAKKGKTEKALAELRQEIHILNSLTECDYVIKMLDWFETKAEICVVTEYAQGELYEILEDDTTLPEPTVRLIAIQLVKSLQYLHANRIIHRDMKPQNILIGANGTIKLCDFGFARSMSANTSLLTSIKGTPLYMAPELVRDMPYNHTTDLWSLGVILYELFVGQPPFFTNSFYTLVHLIVDNPVKYPSNMSEEFKDFLQGLLQKTPSKRLSWPHLATHPFIRETPEEEALRAEALRKVAVQQICQQPHHRITAPPSIKQTPRGEGEEVKGFGGVKKPPTANSIIQAHQLQAQQQQQQQLPQHQQPSQRNNGTSTASTTSSSPSSNDSTSIDSSNSSSGTSGMADSNSASDALSTNSTRSRSSSTDEFDITQLPTLLSPSHAATLSHTLIQFSTLLQQSATSSTIPSPLLTIFPQLLTDHVPTHLCSLLIGLHLGHYSGCSLAQLLPTLLHAFRFVVHPDGGSDHVSLTPIHFEETMTGPGRSLPSFEVQLRRAIGEQLVANSHGMNGFQILSTSFRSLVTQMADVQRTPPSGQPTPNLSHLIIIFFQCARSSSSSTPGGLIERFARDHELLASITQLLLILSGGVTHDDTTERARTAGRILFLLATLCGKQPTIVKTLLSYRSSTAVPRTTNEFDSNLIVTYLDHPNQLLSVGASFLLSHLLTNPHANMSNQIAQPLKLLQIVRAKLSQFSSTAIPTAITPPINTPTTKNVSLPPHSITTPICALEGTGLMYSLLGSLDGYLQIIQSVLYFLALQANNPTAQIITNTAIQPTINFLITRIWELILARMERVHTYKSIPNGAHPTDSHRAIAGELSINGWMAFLTITLDILKYTLKPSNTSATMTPNNTNFDLLFRGLCHLISPVRIANLYAWPDTCGGGSSGVGLLLKRVINIIYLPFTIPTHTNSSGPTPSSATSDAMLARVQKLLFNESIVRRLLVALRYIELPNELEVPIGLLAQLCIRSPYFERQIIEYQGLQLFAAKSLLNPEPRIIAPNTTTTAVPSKPATSGTAPTNTVLPSSALLLDTMNIIAQLARSSADNYPAIQSANFLSDLTKLLQHPDSSVRAKTCNVLGNLCRHSSFFYPTLLAEPNLLSLLVRSCSDSSGSVRKWSAFALGNAVFHDPSISQPITAAIPALLHMLRKDEDEKATQNAVGVLANLLRHGCATKEILAADAISILTDLLHHLFASTPTPIQYQSARSAIFTLQHLANDSGGRRQLASSEVMTRLTSLASSPPAKADGKVQTYFQRLFTRLTNNK